MALIAYGWPDEATLPALMTFLYLKPIPLSIKATAVTRYYGNSTVIRFSKAKPTPTVLLS
mgnify:CR=1 FL=1